jgi:hypothetical protein
MEQAKLVELGIQVKIFSSSSRKEKHGRKMQATN